MLFQSRRLGDIGWVMQSLLRLTSWFKDQRDRRSPDSATADETRRPHRVSKLPGHLDDYEVEYSSQRAHSHSQAALSARSRNDTREYLRLCCQLALNQLERYKELLGQTPVYWAAVILHPSLSARWVSRVEPYKANLILERFQRFFFDGWAVTEPVLRPKTPEEPNKSEGCLPDLLPTDFYKNTAEGDGPAVQELKAWFGKAPEKFDNLLATARTSFPCANSNGNRYPLNTFNVSRMRACI
ncbi:hypothetical protein BGZ61DRAFT_565184 [Ilyonectria robusta]|uniref:uncharacterized protein n=1 Tax=Ilyonectria robusta TaxID=1079257 RepID=UPI001E8E2E7E|nr:uncharacterized protein BGZ61DRAFT_565184 [Ilyonectria robusta]KAH8659746.1 hypothetical protein BGZ61DRAFT_565184 [Ilyonectria robusta]